MYLLSQQELEKIKNRVAIAQVDNPSLTIDLVDHICCMIEERVGYGINLRIAEDEVLKELGEVQLKAIGIETKLLTQNKFTMKKRTKIIGLVAIILMFAGFAMKMLHLQGAGVTWGVGVLTAVFGFTLFLTLDKFSYEKSSLGKINSVLGYLGAAAYLMGIGFNVLKFPLSYILMGAGGLILLVYYFINNMIDQQNKVS
jgi:hypothetical protein